MVSGEFLHYPQVRQWLDGVEPAWTLLSYGSFVALQTPPAVGRGAIAIAEDLRPDELAGSAVVRNTLILLREAVARRGGLALTATGKLARAAVADMLPLMEWPHYNQADHLSVCKVVNEPDFLPLHVVHTLARAARLVHARRGKLLTTPLGRTLLDEARQGGLAALLFRHAFWHVNLAYFGRGALDPWPQGDIGVVLWSLSLAASDWQTPARLARLCTIPIPAVVAANPMSDHAAYYMESRVLEPLLWFGLLELRAEKRAGRLFTENHRYRKAPLFERTLRFTVKLEGTAGERH